MVFEFWTVLGAKENCHHLQLGDTNYFLQPPLLCTVPVSMSGRWLQRPLLSSRAEQTGWRKDFWQGSSQLRRRVLCRCATSPLQLGSMMLVVAFLVLRGKRLTAVVLACPKQLPFSCTSYCCLPILAGQNPSFSSLPLLACSGSCSWTALAVLSWVMLCVFLSSCLLICICTEAQHDLIHRGCLWMTCRHWVWHEGI